MDHRTGSKGTSNTSYTRTVPLSTSQSVTGHTYVSFQADYESVGKELPDQDILHVPTVGFLLSVTSCWMFPSVDCSLRICAGSASYADEIGGPEVE